MIRNSLAGDVESGAMIDGRSNDRQPKSDVHRPAEREALYRDQTLVVVTGCDGVELSFERAQKKRVSAGKGPLTLRSLLRHCLIAGSIWLASSEPNRPCSPACGLSPATAIRGRATPSLSSSRLANSIAPATRSEVIALIASARLQ